MSNWPPPDTIFFFGCSREAGHYLHTPDLSSRNPFHPRRWADVIPWGNALDAGLLDETKPQVEGQVAWAHHELRDAYGVIHWSAVSWWDRSVDSRPGSNCAFLVNEYMDPARLLERALIVYPSVFARFKYPVQLGRVVLEPGAGKFIHPVVHQGGADTGLAMCGQPMDVGNVGSIVNCPGCWKAQGFCEQCGCPPEKTCSHQRAPGAASVFCPVYGLAGCKHEGPGGCVGSVCVEADGRGRTGA